MDLLVIGSGISGLSAAIEAKMQGQEVMIVSKTYPTKSQSCMAQGGINAAIGTGDSTAQHAEDTLKAAYGLADESTVRFFCEEAPRTIAWLEQMGVPFSRTPEKGIAQRKLGGSRAARACYAQDYTGLKILHTLYDACLRLEIPMRHERFLLRLSEAGERVSGAVFWNIQQGGIETVAAKTTLLATGGFAKIYGPHATNSASATGDGIAAAANAGCRLRHMEFVQFHPTALKGSSILISESARGAGGHLLNREGERFVDELLPRDAVARAIHVQLTRGSEVFLDIRHLGEAFIDEHLPQERHLAQIYEGIDPVETPIPIKPAAHYTMGGIWTEKLVKTDCEGLLASGECACNAVHGANRLGGNSLLEAVVFGREAAKVAGESRSIDTPAADVAEDSARIKSLLGREGRGCFYTLRRTMHDLMQNRCGLVRDESGLQEAREMLAGMADELEHCGISDDSWVCNTQLMEYHEFSSSVVLAQAVVEAALARKESVGAHFRNDSATKEA